MSTTRDTMLLFAGVAIGSVAGFTVANVAAPRERTPDAPVVVRETAQAPSAGVALEPVVEQERAARAQVEKERDALRLELAQVKSASAVAAALPERRRDPRPRTAPPAPPARPLATIATDAEDAIAKKDAERAVRLLRELSGLGRPAWPLIEKLADATFDANEDDDKGTQDVRQEIVRLFYRTDLSALALDALLDASSHSAETRRLAAYGSGGLEATPEQATRLVALVKTETDPDMAASLLGVLLRSNALDASSALDLLRGQTDARTRRALANGLTETDQAWVGDALAQLAQSDPDADIQKMARLALAQRNPTVQGYLVTGIVPNSQAASAGIQEGDIIVSYNGSDVRSEKQLARLKSGIAQDANVQVSVWRDGSLVQLSMKPGSIGVYGSVVKPGAADKH
ncbi:MAG TPA: PDZ domain-containing protein [Planctomycetota bacterium]|nr:PDZ domain-containing protein [Planctomycetota bacterium]